MFIYQIINKFKALFYVRTKSVIWSGLECVVFRKSTLKEQIQQGHKERVHLSDCADFFKPNNK